MPNLRLKKMDYVAFHKAFGGMKTRGEYAEFYRGAILTTKNIPAKKCRQKELSDLVAYYYNRQYDMKAPWSASTPKNPIPLHQRKPKITIPLAKKSCKIIASSLFGQTMAPRIFVEKEEELTSSIVEAKKAFYFDQIMLDAIEKMCVTGASFLRFSKIDDVFHGESYFSDVCYPKFDEYGDLVYVLVQFVYKDPTDSVEKWFKMVCTQNEDIKYSNPKYNPEEVPVFKEVLRNEHKYGFVSGVWLANGTKTMYDFDGDSLIKDYLTIFDDINYQLSAQSSSVIDNCIPQLFISGVDQDDVELFSKSSEKIWNLGRDGKAEFLEGSLRGVEKGMSYIKMLQSIYSDASGIPVEQHENAAKNASSGVALRILQEGLVLNIKLLRMRLTNQICEAIDKITTIYHNNPILFQKEVGIAWYEIVNDTPQDIYQKAQAADILCRNGVISKKTITKSFADDYGIEDIEKEVELIFEEKSKETQNDMEILSANLSKKAFGGTENVDN